MYFMDAPWDFDIVLIDIIYTWLARSAVLW